MYPFTVTLRTF